MPLSTRRAPSRSPTIAEDAEFAVRFQLPWLPTLAPSSRLHAPQLGGPRRGDQRTDRPLPDRYALPADDSEAVIASEGLLGGNFLELVPGGSPFNLAPGDEVYETQSAVSLTTLLLRAVSGGDVE